MSGRLKGCTCPEVLDRSCPVCREYQHNFYLRKKAEGFYVYVDYTKEPVPRCFYVGKGDYFRASAVRRNNKHTWVRKHFGFERRIIIRTDDESEAFEYETLLIDKLGTFNPDFKDYTDIRCNWTRGGDGASGHKMPRASVQRGIKKRSDLWKDPKYRAKRLAIWTPEMRAKYAEMSRQRNTGRKMSDEARANMRAAQRARTLEEGYREKMRNRALRQWADPEKAQRAREAARNRKPLSPEAKANIAAAVSAAHKGRKKSDEQRRKMSEAAKGKPVSGASKAALADAVRKNWADPKYKAKMKEAFKKRTPRRPTSEEAKANMSAAQKKRWQEKLGHSDEAKAKIQKKSLERWADPEFRAKWLKARHGKCEESA